MGTFDSFVEVNTCRVIVAPTADPGGSVQDHAVADDTLGDYEQIDEVMAIQCRSFVTTIQQCRDHEGPRRQMSRVSALRQEFASFGIAVTGTRVDLRRLAGSLGSHPLGHHLTSLVRPKSPGLSLGAGSASVANTLQIGSYELGSGRARYAVLASGENTHRNRSCGSPASSKPVISIAL